MSLKRKIALTGGVLLFVVLLLITLLTGIYFYLPHYLESRLIPQLAADAGISDVAVDIRNIGLFAADLGALHIGPAENPALVVQSVQIDYSPRSLYQKKIKKITLSGIELYTEISGGSFKLRGLDIEKLMAGRQQRQEPAAAPDEAPLLVAVSRLEIRNSQVIIGYNDQFHSVPLELDVVAQDSEFNRLNIAARLYPLGQKITAAIEVNRVQNRAEVVVDCKNLNLDRLADTTARLTDFTISGEASVHGRAEVFWAPLRMASLNASLTLLRHTKIAVGDVQFQNVLSARSEEVPFQIDLAASGDNEWRVTGSSLAMVTPTPLTLAGFDCIIKRNEAAFESSGNFSAVLHSSDQNEVNPLPVKFRDPLPLQGRFSAVFHHPGKWEFKISNEPATDPSAKPVRINVEPYTITLSPPDFNLSAEAASRKIEAAYTLRAPKVRIDSASDSVYIPKIDLKGAASLAEENEVASRITFDLQAPNTGLKSEGMDIKISNFSIIGRLNGHDVRHMRLAGVMQFTGAGGRFSDLDARLTDARGKIPFEWPVEGKTEKGSVSIAGLMYKDMNLGGMKSNIRQTPSGFAFEGQHQSSLVPNLKLAFAGESKLYNVASRGASIRVELSRPGSAPEIDLGKFFPQAKGFRINGKFDLTGDFALDGRGFSGKLQADFNDGRVSSLQSKLTLEGIRMSLSFPELPRIRSGPGQTIHFSKFSLGDLIAEKGSVDFQIESARSFLIEKMHFLWCDGHVETQSMRLSPGVEDYRITFYCDRLNLAKVLEQFGAAAAEGRGTVNGRIPLQYANGKISFDDGFLFSTPGDGGKIRLTGTDILTAGIPPNTSQFVQMEVASEALKDYDYSWAKLNITSQGEELLLQMQMDGKPAKTLPFVYNKDIGGFMKVEADAKGSKFQGIRLDVNFRLPLNQLLRYKELINMMK
ncbi:MAG: YdbH domain-containing protein [Desulfobacterales bacterium]|nr:MAG: YdbH domain-containing protein [Desulfobacterales bacterium]